MRSIFFWIEDTAKEQEGGVDVQQLNPLNWVMPRDVKLLYNGTVYHDYRGTSSQVFDLMNSDVPSQFANSIIRQTGTGVAATAFASDARMTNWVNLPFSQIYEQLSGSHLMVRGKAIENAVVNLSLKTPAAKSTYVLHAVYAYNALLFCSAGSAEYVF